MANEILHPNGDSTPLQWTTTGSNHWDEINDPVASANDSTYITAAGFGHNDTDRFDLDDSALTDEDVITQVAIKVRYRSMNDLLTLSLELQLWIGGSNQGTETIVLTNDSAWHNVTLNNTGWNADWTAAELDGAQVDINTTKEGLPSTIDIDVSAIEIDINYTGSSAQISTSGDLFIAGHSTTTTSGDLFMHGHDSTSSTKIYWSDLTLATIKRSNLDGTSVEIIDQGVDDHAALVIHNESRKIFFTNVFDNTLYSMNLDGTNKQLLIDEPSLSTLRGITIDRINEKVVYTIRQDDPEIKRMNLDGSSLEVIVPSGSGLVTIWGIDIFEPSGKMFWADTGKGTIDRANVDGSNVETIISGLTFPTDVAVDEIDEKLYWSDPVEDVIQVSDLNGDDISIIVSGGIGPSYMVLDTSGSTVVAKNIYFGDVTHDFIRKVKIATSEVTDIVGPNEIILAQGIDIDYTLDDINLFIIGHATFQASGDLFIGGYETFQASGDLYVEGSSEATQFTSSGNLYIAGYDIIDNSGNLFVVGYETTESSGDLFVQGHINTNASGDLFIDGYSTTTTSGDLFIEGWDSTTSSGDMFIEGSIQILNSGDLFVYGHRFLTGSGNLYIAGPASGATASGSLYTVGLDDFAASGDLYLAGYIVSSGQPSLYINGIGFKPASGNLFTLGRDSTTVSGDLFVEGYESIIGSGDLFIDGKDSVRISGDLFISGQDSINASGDLFIKGFIATIVSGDLFVEGHMEIQTSGNLFIDGVVEVSSVPTLTLFIYGYDNIVISGDLFIEGTIEASGAQSPSLFIHGSDILSTSGDMFITGNSDADDNANLYIGGLAVLAVSGDLFINGYETLQTSGDFFIKGHNNITTSGSLLIEGHGLIPVSGDLFIKAPEQTIASGDLFIQGDMVAQTIADSGDLFIRGHLSISGIPVFTLFIEGYVLVYDDVSLIITGSGTISHSRTTDMFINGFEPRPALSCPTLDPTASIQIKDSLITIYQERIDALINQLGKNVYLEFDPIRDPCPNCEYDTQRKRSRGIYIPGGPIPFARGRRCPYCKGRGFTETEVNKCIKCLIKWNPEDAEDFGIAVSQAKDIARLKTYLTEADDLIRAKTAILNHDIVDQMKMRARMVQSPIPVGLREDRYCISFWELI